MDFVSIETSFPSSEGAWDGAIDDRDEVEGRGVTTPAVYAREILGMLGFLALARDFENPFFQFATAALLPVGVLGNDASSGDVVLWDEISFAKGSDWRKAWEAVAAAWIEERVLRTREEIFVAKRLDLRGGRVEEEAVGVAGEL